MSYDDQNYSKVNPDTLQDQDWEEVALTVWAALRPCREVSAASRYLPENKAIRWAKPKKWNPDCGFEVLVPGKFFGKFVFATVALNIVGDDFEIYVQRRFHDLVLVFSTREDGPILSPQARLQAAVGKMLELTKLFDTWSRQKSLAENFPTEWIGTPLAVLIRSFIANKYLSRDWKGDSWSGLSIALLKKLLVIDDLSIEARSQHIMRAKGWGRRIAINFNVAKSVTFVLSGCFIFALLLVLSNGFHGSGESFLLSAWKDSWNAILDLANPSDVAGQRTWLSEIMAFPVALLLCVLYIFLAVASLRTAICHGIAIWIFVRSRFGRTILITSYVSLAITVVLLVGVGMREMRLISAANVISAQSTGPEADQVVQDASDLKMHEPVTVVASQADSFDSFYAAESWLADMSFRLESQVSDPEERLRILRRVHYEATRWELPPELVLAVIDVESNFDRYAVSVTGAVGLMQVMPFWTSEIGRPNDNLINIETNLRYGCTILRYYLDMENGDLGPALVRYNGNRGPSDYPNKVLDKLRSKWHRI